MNRLEVSGAAALAGVTIFQIHSMYIQHAGSLSDVRDAPAGDPSTAQHLQDADVLTGGLVLLAGLTLAIATGKWYMLALAALALAIVAGYYHLACQQAGYGRQETEEVE